MQLLKQTLVYYNNLWNILMYLILIKISLIYYILPSILLCNKFTPTYDGQRRSFCRLLPRGIINVLCIYLRTNRDWRSWIFYCFFCLLLRRRMSIPIQLDICQRIAGRAVMAEKVVQACHGSVKRQGWSYTTVTPAGPVLYCQRHSQLTVPPWCIRREWCRHSFCLRAEWLCAVAVNMPATQGRAGDLHEDNDVITWLF